MRSPAVFSLTGFILALVLAPGAARAAEGVLTLQIENDRIAATDRHYTQGGRLSYLSGEEKFPAWIGWLGNALIWGPLFDFGEGDKIVQRRGYAIGQSIFTPEDVRSTTLVTGDRPYAGWLYAGFSAHKFENPLNNLFFSGGADGSQQSVCLEPPTLGHLNTSEQVDHGDGVAIIESE